MKDRQTIVFFLLAILTAIVGLCLVSCGEEGGDDSDESDNMPDDDDSAGDDDMGDDDSTDDDDDDDAAEEGPYYQDFLRYWTTMDENYAYFLEKGVDWNEVFQENEPVAYAQTDPADFGLLIARLAALLRDSHTRSSFAGVPNERLPFRQPTGVCLERIGDSAYVSRLTPEAEAAGLELGDNVLSLDEEPVDDILDRAKTWEGCSTAHCCDFYRLPHVDRYSEGDQDVFYAVLRNGVPLEFELSRSGYGESSCKSEALIRFLEDAQGDVLRYKPIGEDLGYIHLSTLSGGYEDQILLELDQAIESFAGCSGIVFDARYNRGGSDLVAMGVLSRFLDRIVFPVAFRYKNGPAHDDFTPWIPEPVLPGANPLTVPVVFLVNGACISAADFFSAAAAYVPGFTLMGTTTCGATGAPDQDTLPVSGITYTYSQMQRKYLATNEQIEGIGIAPDIVVQFDPEDLALAVDTQIEAAVDYLRDALTLHGISRYGRSKARDTNSIDNGVF